MCTGSGGEAVVDSGEARSSRRQPDRHPDSVTSACRVDDVGVHRLTEADTPWQDVPAYVAEATLQSVDADSLVDTMLDGAGPWPISLQRRLLHPASGSAAALVPVPPGAVTLDLGTGWAALSGALESMGSAVVRADWVYSRLRFGQLMHPVPSASAVHLRLGGTLPWSDETFDLVFLDLTEIEQSSSRHADPRESRATVLSEVRRVLTRDGVAVVGTRTRPVPIGWRTRSRRAEQDRRTSRLWDAVRRPHGDQALRDAGFQTRRAIVPYPSRARLKWLIPEERLRDHLWRVASTSHLKRAVARLLCAAGAAAWFVPESYVVVQRREAHRHSGSRRDSHHDSHHDSHRDGDADAVRTLGELLVSTPGDPPPVSLALTDARLAVLGVREFAKLPLSASQADALAAEMRKTALERSTAFSPYVIPSGRVAERHGHPFAVYPRIVERRGRPDEKRGVVDSALRGLRATDVAPVRSTACWQRLSGARGRDDAEQIGAAALRSAVLRTCGDAILPVGPTHGDLHAGNVLLPVAGHPLLVDWNRFEVLNPLLLDGVYAAVRDHMLSTRETLAHGLVSFVDGRVHGPLADRADELTGELDRLQAVTIVLLDRIVSYSLPRRRHKPWTMPPFREACRALQARTDDAWRPSAGQ